MSLANDWALIRLCGKSIWQLLNPSNNGVHVEVTIGWDSSWPGTPNAGIELIGCGSGTIKQQIDAYAQQIREVLYDYADTMPVAHVRILAGTNIPYPSPASPAPPQQPPPPPPIVPPLPPTTPPTVCDRIYYV